MDGFSLTLTTHTPFFTNRTRFPSLSRTPIPLFPPKTNFIVLSSKDDPKLDPLDQMELKFGRMIGEDPKLTLAKILGRKANPEASYMDIEKSFYKNKGKIVEIKEVPFGVPKNAEADKPLEGLELGRPVVPKKVKSSPLDGLNLARPVPKKGVKFEVDDKPRGSEVRKLSRPVAPKAVESSKGSVPNVILRKPSLFSEDDVDDTRPRLRIKPNLSLKMRIEQPKEQFSDMTLLRKPEPVIVDDSSEKKQEESSSNVGSNVTGDVALLRKPKVENVNGSSEMKLDQFSSVDTKVIGEAEMEMLNEEINNEVTGFTLLEKPKSLSIEKGVEIDDEEIEQKKSTVIDDTENNVSKDLSEVTASSSIRRPSLGESIDGTLTEIPSQTDDYPIGLQPHKQSSVVSSKEIAEDQMSSTSAPVSNVELSVDAALQGKPKRLDQPVKEAPANTESIAVELENPLSTSPSGHEDDDWIAAEELVKSGNRGDVELISASTRGFVVSFRSLVGFLPYRNLAFKWKFLAFESWLRRKGLDPSLYRRNLGVIGSYDVTNKINPNLENDAIVIKNEGEVTPDMKLEELLGIYDQEKIKFLSSFVGQKVKVNVVLANKKSGKLVFSVKPKEKEESIERKRSLMAKLQVGDVVKCCIKKITYFGVFVEVEGVPALIHQTEISWDATLDPSSYFKVGQIVEAKVYQLDFALERIFLSLKEIMPDPLMETLESVVGDNEILDGRLKAAEADTKWDDVESLIKELEQTEGIQSVSKGRFFLSPGLAPTFQVYMASMFENQYKLLARSENKVQEVIVQTSLDKEEMKSVILRCTSRVG
ncbi:uncharacterized protein LOC126793618 isoform X1 [Argentina anserina]|uniref:uncharacterized protein LOC126793618 isoform X1 n=1 Tax=Argentina anserina TaxID=57926 RepID=UPI0021768298|nr:uncharacterized protein LOC126793618 isoform X1 [Potentilla anserina]